MTYPKGHRDANRSWSLASRIKALEKRREVEGKTKENTKELLSLYRLIK
jgi:hypothetical protein